MDAGSFGRLTGGELGMARPGRRRMCVQDCRRMGPTVPFGRGEMCVAASGATGAPGKSGRDPARHVSARPPSLAAPAFSRRAVHDRCRGPRVLQNEGMQGGVQPAGVRRSAPGRLASFRGFGQLRACSTGTFVVASSACLFAV